jgi:hypothetical protein
MGAAGWAWFAAAAAGARPAAIAGVDEMKSKAASAVLVLFIWRLLAAVHPRSLCLVWHG